MSADPRRVASPSGTGREYPPELVHGELCATRFSLKAVCDCGKEPEPGARGPSGTGHDTPYTPGRFVVSWVGADGARDPIALTSQVKVMREGFERLGHKPALILVVVADAEVDVAADLICEALDA